MNLKNKTLEIVSKNSAGQAALEYILILVISVAVIMGLVARLNNSFKVYFDSYMGQYLTCLLETGELPTLGAQDGSVNISSCNEEFEEFTFESGRPPKANTGGSSK